MNKDKAPNWWLEILKGKSASHGKVRKKTRTETGVNSEYLGRENSATAKLYLKLAKEQNVEVIVSVLG